MRTPRPGRGSAFARTRRGPARTRLPTPTAGTGGPRRRAEHGDRACRRRAGLHLADCVLPRQHVQLLEDDPEAGLLEHGCTRVAWRRGHELLAGADLPGQLELLDYLPQLEEHFAAGLVLRLEPWRYPEVQARPNQMVNWGSSGGQLRRNTRLLLARTSSVSQLSLGMWQ
ncbi:hypothetical protein JOD27_008174 [Lentzea nigeriaca]|nr:hypothetical protein [Lentzea nigeriaca]